MSQLPLPQDVSSPGAEAEVSCTAMVCRFDGYLRSPPGDVHELSQLAVPDPATLRKTTADNRPKI